MENMDQDAAQVVLDEYARLIGSELMPVSGRWRTACPFPDHDDQGQAFSIYPGSTDGRLLWCCHGCQRKGRSPAKLADALGVPYTKTQAASSITGDGSTDPNPQEYPDEFVECTHRRLLASPTSIEFLQELRMISLEAITALRIGLDEYGRYIFPAHDADGHVLGMKARKWTGKHGWETLFGEVNLFGVDAIQQSIDAHAPLILCEGESDTVAMRSARYHAVGVPGAGRWKDEWQHLFRGVDLVIAFHHEAASERSAARIAGQVSDTARSVRILTWPSTCTDQHDITDELLEHGPRRLQQLIKRARQYKPSVERPRRHGPIDWAATPHARIPHAVRHDSRLQPIDVLVYLELQTRCDSAGEWVRIPHETIASMVRCSRQTVMRSLARLEEAGHVDIRRLPAAAKEAHWYRLL